MDWIRRLHEPFFGSAEDAETYVDVELRAALLEGWRFRRAQEPLAWIVEKNSGNAPMENYGVRVSRGLDLVILTYGNSDAGAFNLSLVLQNALVVEAGMLRGFPLRRCLQHLFERKPNLWGLT